MSYPTCIVYIPGNKGGCNHESEDDTADESDMEEGEIAGSDEEEAAGPQLPAITSEVQAKLDHPERQHKMLCFNDRGEVRVVPSCGSLFCKGSFPLSSGTFLSAAVDIGISQCGH